MRKVTAIVIVVDGQWLMALGSNYLPICLTVNFFQGATHNFIARSTASRYENIGGHLLQLYIHV